MHLAVHDAKSPFPAELHGDWGLVLDNLVQPVNPGGCIQWGKPDYSPRLPCRRGLPDSKYDLLAEFGCPFRNETISERFRHGGSTLPELMKQCNLKVYSDVVSTDRVAELRRPLTENNQILLLNTAQSLAEKGALGPLTPAAVEKAREDIAREVEGGAYLEYDLWTAVGIKSR